MMTEIEEALLETEPFQWSHQHAALTVEADADDPDTITIVAGVADGDWEYLPEQWLTAAFIALPQAEVEDADIVPDAFGDEEPQSAARIRLSLPDGPRQGDA